MARILWLIYVFGDWIRRHVEKRATSPQVKETT